MNPIQKFLIDLLEAAVLGAAIAAVSLPETVNAKEAVGLVVGGVIGAIKGGARVFLVAYIAARKPA